MRANAQFKTTEFEESPAPGTLAPHARDELIYEWVVFEGKSQVEVASMLDISQGTVSRALQRYERRQAHAEPREGGRLDPAERQRVQRWLTYERNERILRSCLRIASDVEGFVDTTKSTFHRDGLAGDGNQIRTVHATLDRSGTAARFLRLAFRINMEQLKLVEMEPLAPLPPLSAEELAELARDADGTERDPSKASEPAVKLAELDTVEELAGSEAEQHSDVRGVNGRDAETREGAAREGEAAAESRAAEQELRQAASRTEAGHPDKVPGDAHSAHQRIGGESGATIDRRCSCDAINEREKMLDERRIAPDDGNPREKRRARPARVVYGGMPLDDDALSAARESGP
jgi:transposase